MTLVRMLKVLMLATCLFPAAVLAQSGGGGSTGSSAGGASSGGSSGSAAGGAASGPTAGTGSAVGSPNAGSAGAGTAGVSGVPSGPANAGGLNNSVNDPSGGGNSAKLPTAPGINTVGRQIHREHLPKRARPPIQLRLDPSSSGGTTQVGAKGKTASTGVAGSTTGAAAKINAVLDAENKKLDKKIKSICRGC